jgi:hypothetical protein
VIWAQWLDANTEGLALAHEAAGRKAYAFPLLPPQGTSQPGDAIRALLPSLGKWRSLADALRADALRAAGDGRMADARRDVHDIMRLARLLMNRSTLIEDLVGYAIMRTACDCITALLKAQILSTADARGLLEDMESLPAIPDIDLTGERFGLLDTCCYCARFGLYRPIFPEQGSVTAPFYAPLIPVNYGAAMREVNQIFDQVESCYRLPTYRQRVDALQDLDLRLTDSTALWIERTITPLALASMGPPGTAPSPVPPKQRGVTWMWRPYESRQAMIVQMNSLRIALALAAYKLETGDYPAALDVLAGPRGILKEIPRDGFADGPFTYQRHDAGYLLYSVGKDMIDDGGDEKKDSVIQMAK